MCLLMSVHFDCCSCGKPTIIQGVDQEGYLAWQHGQRIQDALPSLHRFWRECLISRMCPNCVKSVFNVPVPGKDDWGQSVGECELCGATLYKKDLDAKKCPCCRAPINMEVINEVQRE